MAKARKSGTNSSLTRRKRKIAWQALETHVRQHPEATLKDRAKLFGVNTSITL
jgi:hypothetical protein